ncbi:MAG: DUF2817 domain-containing protein [Gammaproteobacteria bacterium]|nr:DUF2817 domain-containing protein [Gammaproteobacteria bacterium]MBQ0775450.1 DUF2817 domain-containing protein [Gammaproteobacteria bacterium]
MLTALLSDAELGLFQHQYSSARQQFLARINRVPHLLNCNAHGLDEQGPDGEALFTDCAWIGSDGARRVLILISGTHGAEGFAGSAIQSDFATLLATKQWQLPDDTAVLIIHALNPWGMAWQRRCDQNGVDLNRNFVDFHQPLPSNEGYNALHPWLMQEDNDALIEQTNLFRAHHSQTALELAISGGQYNHPDGPFFGGTHASPARTLIESLIDEHLLGERRLAVIDLHTGLGPYGYGEVICDHPPNSKGAQTAHDWFGASVTLPFAGTSSSVPKQGLLDYCWHAIMNHESCFVTLEFGTYSIDSLFNSLLEDHRLHANPNIDWHTEACQKTKQKLMQHFYPNDPQWQEMVLLRGRQIIRLALEGLSR